MSRRLHVSRRAHATLAVLAATAATACGQAREPLVPVGRVLDEQPALAGAPWARLIPGTNVVVTPARGCVEEVVTSAGSTSGVPLEPATWKGNEQQWTIVDAALLSGEDGHLALTLRAASSNETRVLRIPAGKAPVCVAEAGQAGASAARLGKAMRFDPTLATCTHVEAKGPAVGVVLRNEDPSPVVFTRLVLAGEHATDADASADAKSKRGAVTAWASTKSGDLRVRGDVLATCFLPDASGAKAAGDDDDDDDDDAPATGHAKHKPKAKTKDAASASPGTNAFALLHLDPRRCTKSEAPQGDHVTCTVPVGVWQGVDDGDETLSLRLVRRTLDPMHFLGGRPVDGRGFASTIVALETAPSSDPRVQAVDDRLRSSVERVLAADDGIRVSKSDQDTPNLRLRLDVSQLNVSDASWTTTSVPHEYQVGTKQEPNPKKERAQAAVEAARDGVPHAREACDEKKEDAKNKYEECMNAVHAAANMANGQTERTMNSTGEAGCQIWRATMDTTCPEIEEAQRKLDQAREEEADTPATIDVPVMKKTSYPKRTVTRNVTATVQLSGTLDGAALPSAPQPFTRALSDYEVIAKPEEQVPGHAATASWIQNPDAAVPEISALLAEWVATQAKALVSRARLERAKAELKASGEDVELKPGFEAVQALAFEVAGARLKKMARSGTLVAKKGKALPLPSDVNVHYGECLLAIALLPEGSAGGVELSTSDRAVADLRGRAFADVEVCPRERDPGASAAGIALSTSEDGANVRWALFKTRYAPGMKARDGEPAMAHDDADGASDDDAASSAHRAGGSGGDVPPGADVVTPRARPAPLEAIAVGVRPGIGTWIAGSAGDNSLGDVFSSGPSLAVDAGVRFGGGWLAYGEWERAFLGVGASSPLASVDGATAQGDSFLLGVRKAIVEPVIRLPGIGPATLAPIVDVALGYSVLHQEATTPAGVTESFSLPSGLARVAAGASLRPARILTIDALVGATGGWVDQIEVHSSSGSTQRDGTAQFHDGSARVGLFAGLGVGVELPLGEGGAPASRQAGAHAQGTSRTEVK